MTHCTRLGVLGGTFDPVHLGHFRVAESVRETMALDRILFVPSRIPPHKSRPGIAPAEHRFRMIQEAVKKEPAFDISRIELDRDGPSYTIDTLNALACAQPETDIFFITGIDAFREIQTWKQWELLLPSFSFIVHPRPGYSLAGAREAVPETMLLVTVRSGSTPPSDHGPAIFLVHAVTLDISSTEIRAMARAGRSVRYLVPAEVEAYIIGHRLYRDGD